jgi:hypothetical protein
MSARGILDMDMHTLGRGLLQGARWWVDEIRGVIPRRWRGLGGERLPRLAYRDGALAADGGRRSRAAPGLRAAVVVPQALCLSRLIERPVVNERDLQRMLALEGETLLPFPAGTMLVAGRVLGPATEPGRIRIEVAGLPLDHARQIAAAIAEAGIVAARIERQSNGDPAPAIDFAPAMRATGLIAPPRRTAALLWALVAFLVGLNLAAWIWRDAAEIDRLNALVEAQRPAVAVAQRISRRIAQDRLAVTRTTALRQRNNALGGLAEISEALPPGAWLQRYVWDGETVRLAGYKPARADVAGALRRSGRFAEVRQLAEETQVEVPLGARFDLSARIERR